MHIQDTPLKPLSGIELTPDETIMMKWLRTVPWIAVKDSREASCKARVPEFYSGVKLYRKQAGGASAGSLGALEIFIKKLGFSGIISKQNLYPVTGHGTEPRYLTLRKTDLDNLGVGKDEEEED